MIISHNAGAELAEFEQLLKRTHSLITSDSKSRIAYYLCREGSKLETDVCDFMKQSAIGTPFDGSIELYGGRNFPDIVAKKYFGVEVKTSTKQNAPWKSTGNSILESSRIESVERIYMFFGKLVDPVEFRYKKYEECLYDICVTHSPRYMVDIETPAGETIFDKIGIPYDKLRVQENPIKTITSYFRQHLEEGEELWWLETEEPQVQPPSVKIKFWNNLPITEQESLKSKMFGLFPEIVGVGPAGSDKYARAAAWLVTKNGIVAPSFRDIFTGGRRFSMRIGEVTYGKIPKIFHHLQGKLLSILSCVDDFPSEEIEFYWRRVCERDQRRDIWLQLFKEQASQTLREAHSTLNISTFVTTELS